MKKIAIVAACCLVVALGGKLALDQWATGSRTMLPEGYSAPDGKVAATAKTQGGPVKVTDLDIASNVPKYYEDFLEIVAFAPGSGWMKLKTRDGISPTIAFDGVTAEAIEAFNRLATSQGLPLRASLDGSRLSLTAQETENDFAYFAAKGQPASPPPTIAFYKPNPGPQLAMQKDESGKVFLVRVDPPERSKEVLAMKMDKELAVQVQP